MQIGLRWSRGLEQGIHLCVEDLVLHDVEVHGEEAGLQRGAEGVALHQADLGVGRLVTQEVLLGGHHVL